jgi:disulfide bond formation protein DsbB
MNWIRKHILYIAWTIALLATLGSLYFSNVLHYLPCVLCWYQRIFMYPLVFILGIEILRKDRLIHLYVLPLSVVGFAIGLYQNLLVWNVIPESAAPCTIGAPCTTKFINYLGFVTIPFLSMMAFLLIIVSMIIYKKSHANT